MDERPKISLRGRRLGRPLKARQAELMQTLLPRLRIAPEGEEPISPLAHFDGQFEDCWLEIGFGGGEHLIHQSITRSGIAFIGCEPFVSGMAKAVAAIDKNGLARRVRLFDDDAALLLDRLEEASIGRVYLLFPDPWPKRRHWKRRFVSRGNLDRLAKAMRPGAEFRFASDIDAYVNWTLEHFDAHPEFEWIAESADDWRLPWRDWPGTRYEGKAKREGRKSAFLKFRRIWSTTLSN